MRRWNSTDLSLSSISGDDKNYDEQLNICNTFVEIEESEESVKLWVETIMCANGHAFGYRGMFQCGVDGITIFVGDDNILQYDSEVPSTLKLSLVTRELIVDLGEKDLADKIRIFLNPIKGFYRFKESSEECLYPETDERNMALGNIWEISFVR